MEDNPEKKKLRVLDEDGVTEEVMRLGRVGKAPKIVERISLPQVPEEAPRLERKGGLEDFERRSIEPDIDSIISLADGSGGDQELEWMSGGERKPVPYGWFVLILLLIAGLVATSAVLILRSDKEEITVAKQAAEERIEDDEEREAEATALVESVEATLRRYIAAGSVDELMPLVRDAERVRPMMEDWYARNPIKPRRFEGLGVFQPLDLEGRLFWLITCMVEDEPPETVLMEQTEDGRVFVDWETQVCYQPMSWDDYVKKRPTGEGLDFRVYLRPDFAGFYSHEFDDEEKWSVYRLSAKGSDDYLFGYAPKGSELDEKLIELSRANRGYHVALFLRLRIPEGTTSPRGVIIDEVIGERWARVTPLTGG